MEHLGTKELNTQRLRLRRFTLDDVQAVYRNWASSDEVTRYLTWPTHANAEVTASVVQSWVDGYTRNDYYQWAIVLNHNGNEPIGSIAVVSLDNQVKKAQIGYCIGKNWWHQGIMSEALKAVIDFMIHEVGMQRVEAYHDIRNPHSGAVMKKCGMQYEATLRASSWSNQSVCDAVWYAVLAKDY